MTQAHKTPGAIVRFKDKMFSAPYAPFYDDAKGVKFEVIDPNVYPGHIRIKNLETSVITICHDDEIQTAR